MIKNNNKIYIKPIVIKKIIEKHCTIQSVTKITNEPYGNIKIHLKYHDYDLEYLDEIKNNLKKYLFEDEVETTVGYFPKSCDDEYSVEFCIVFRPPTGKYFILDNEILEIAKNPLSRAVKEGLDEHLLYSVEEEEGNIVITLMEKNYDIDKLRDGIQQLKNQIFAKANYHISSREDKVCIVVSHPEGKKFMFTKQY